MRRLVLMVLMVVLVASAVTASASAKGPDRENLRNWTCLLIEGDFHCWNPAEVVPASGPSATLLVFSGTTQEFLGVETLQRLDIWNRGTPACAQDELLFLPFGYVGCHRYDTTP